jgi:hypothetical protein
MTQYSAEAPVVRVLAKLCLHLLHRFWETASELQAVSIALAEKGVVITAEELAAAKEAVDDVMQLEKAMKPERANEVAALVEQLDRLLEELEKS